MGRVGVHLVSALHWAVLGSTWRLWGRVLEACGRYTAPTGSAAVRAQGPCSWLSWAQDLTNSANGVALLLALQPSGTQGLAFGPSRTQDLAVSALGGCAAACCCCCCHGRQARAARVRAAAGPGSTRGAAIGAGCTASGWLIAVGAPPALRMCCCALAGMHVLMCMC